MNTFTDRRITIIKRYITASKAILKKNSIVGVRPRVFSLGCFTRIRPFPVIGLIVAKMIESSTLVLKIEYIFRNSE